MDEAPRTRDARDDRTRDVEGPGTKDEGLQSAALTHLADNILLFGRVLRAAGLEVQPGRVVDAIRALEWVGVEQRMDVRATLRGLLVHRREDLGRFDQAFDLFFKVHKTASPGPPLFSLGERPRVVVRAAPGVQVPVELEDVGAEQQAGERAVGAWSAHGLSRTKDFADFTDAELARAQSVLESLPWRLGLRKTRRWQRDRRGAVDLRPILRNNVTRGDLVDLPRRRRRERVRPIVLIADVSGSMERYSRVMLHMMYGVVHSGAPAEGFVFATRLTRVSWPLLQRRGRQAVEALVRDVQDWGGGTRIGESLRTFNLVWARRVMRHSPVVIIVSDGWDRGEPEVLDRELARLHRSSHRLIWLNPLLGSVSYEPLTRGMRAALPHIDDFLPVHNLKSVEQLVEHLQSHAT